MQFSAVAENSRSFSFKRSQRKGPSFRGQVNLSEESSQSSNVSEMELLHQWLKREQVDCVLGVVIHDISES